jgi:hypothetical protein
MAKQQTRAGRHPDYEPPRSSTPAGTTYFLGIGIDEYAHWPRLHNAVKDVHAIASLLVDDYGLQSEHTHLLLNEAATEARIVDTFEELTQTVRPEDSVLIYYAGHGHLNERGRGFWVPVDAPRGQVVRYIRNSTIKDYIGDIPSLHTLLISDSCFSGSLFSSGATRGADLAAEELSRLPSRWAICSGRHDEVVADGPQDGHSPFAESILEVLGGSMRPLITTGFLVQQVIEQTRANYDQLPDGGPLQGVGHKRGQFVFRQQKGRGASRLWARIQAAPEDDIAMVDDKKHLIRQYCQDYPKGEHYHSALALGRRLEHKRQFLEAYDSEFGLLALLEQTTPYQEKIQQRLEEFRKLARAESRVERPTRQVEFQAPPSAPGMATATNQPPSASKTVSADTVSFLKYAGLVLLVALVFRVVLLNFMSRVSYGFLLETLYMILLPGAVIWHYFQWYGSWRGAWRLAFVAMAAYLLYNSWVGLEWLAFNFNLLSFPLIGLSSIVPTLLTALYQGERIQFVGVFARSQGMATPQKRADEPAAKLALNPPRKGLFWRYALWCVLAVGIPAYILIYNKVDQLMPLVAFFLFAVLLGGPTVLIWRYGQRALSARKCLALGVLSSSTFVATGLAVDGDVINLGEALVYLLFALVFPIPAWIGIWLKKRRARN